MSLKERLLAKKNKIYSLNVQDEVIHYRHITSAQISLLSAAKKDEFNATIFILCACEKNGDPIFTTEEIEDVKSLGNAVVAPIANAALIGNEVKQQGD